MLSVNKMGFKGSIRCVTRTYLSTHFKQHLMSLLTHNFLIKVINNNKSRVQDIEKEMSTGQNVRNVLHLKFSRWQLPMTQRLNKISPIWHFRFNDYYLEYSKPDFLHFRWNLLLLVQLRQICPPLAVLVAASALLALALAATLSDALSIGLMATAVG